MSSELPYLLKWYNGDEQFSIVPYEFKDPNQDCSICCRETAYIAISKMLSTEIWPPHHPNIPMFLGYQCINRYVKPNFKYVVHRILVEIVGKDLSNLVNEYL